VAAPKLRPNEKPTAGPIGMVVVAGRTADPTLVQKVVDAFAAPGDDKHLFGGVARNLTGGGTGPDAGKSAFTLTVQLLRRPPAEYVRRLAVASPVRPGADDATALDGGE